MKLNKKLVEYIESEILPIYQKNDLGHNVEHVNYVINRSLEIVKKLENINLDIIYTVAAFHDVGVYIDRENHEIVSAKIFYENDKMKEFFSEEEMVIIKEAIEDHRASIKYEPRSIYGKVVSLADKNIDINTILQRTHYYTIKHYPDFTLEKMINRAYEHINDKFGKNGYGKNVYISDEKYEKYLKDVEKLLEDKEVFSKIYIEVNNIEKY